MDGWASGLQTLDADIEWDISPIPCPDFPDRGRVCDALVGHMRRLPLRWFAYEPSGKELIDRGDDVVLIIHERARMPDSDMMLDRGICPPCGQFERGEPRASGVQDSHRSPRSRGAVK